MKRHDKPTKSLLEEEDQDQDKDQDQDLMKQHDQPTVHSGEEKRALLV